jgi:hypothetical protein
MLIKKYIVAGHWWLTLVILATEDAEIRIVVGSQLWVNSSFWRPYLENTQHKTGLVEWLKW